MSNYQLTATDMILRTEDNVWIPPDPDNHDYVEYLKWVEMGGVADPYVAPEPPAAQPTAEQAVLFDHENRLRTFEGKPPLTMDEFTKKLNP